MADLRLFLLGAPRLEVDGQVVEIARRKAWALLIYLAVTGETQRRDTLATLFWPDYDQSAARTALTRHLSELRKVSDPDFLISSRETVALSGDFWLDVEQFQQLVAGCTEANPACRDPLTVAIALYRDDFLTGFTLADSPGFDEWQLFQSESLRQQLAGALERLSVIEGQHGDYATAIAHARRWSALDPLAEPAHRGLMQLYGWSGQWAATLRQYETCCQLLAAELGVPPAPETTQLYEAMKTKRLALPPTPVTSIPVPATPMTAQAPPLATLLQSAIGHNLPPQVTPLIGREADLVKLEALLTNAEMRLLTIVGLGGMGKTRLALACAEEQRTRARFPNGVYFVALAPLSAADHIIPTLAEALGFQLETGGQTRTPHQQVLDYLRQKQLLLVLDNFEHLLDGVEIVADILQAAPGVKILATSRERLHLHEEQLYPIQGLAFPDWEALEDAADYTAVQLFLQSARRIQPHFELTADDIPDLTHICRLVEGMPLGIELAAAWVDTLALADIAAEIRRSLDLLATEVRNIPARHRNMRAVFDASWQRLDEAERKILARLSIFRGGFTRQAAQHIAGASLRQLGKLTSKSHLQYDRNRDRYQIHELLRQYGAEKLAENGAGEAATRDHHSAYYSDLLHQRAALLKGPAQLTALAEIEADFENVRSAWDWAVQQRQMDWIERGVESLSRFCEWYGRYQEGAATFRRAAELLATIDQPLLLARILIKQATFDRVLGNIEQTESLLRQSQRLLADPALAHQETRPEQAAIWQGFAGLATHASQSQAANEQYNRSLALYQAVGDRWAVARVLLEMSYLTRNFSRFAHAQDYWNQLEATKRSVLESTAIFREFGDRAGVAGGLFQLGGVFLFLGQFAEAQTVLKESVAIHKELGLKSGLVLATAHLANANVLLGLHEQAVVEGQFALDLARELAYPAGIHMGLGTAIWAAMRRGDYHEAQRFAQENIALNQMRGEQRELAYSLAFLGIACRELGNTVQARQQLVKALEIAIGTQAVGPLFFCLALANYLLVDAGKYVQAAELDALRATYPVSGSRMMHLPPIVATMTPLPANIRAAAQARGRNLDLWATAQALLAEFSTDDDLNHPSPAEGLPPQLLLAPQRFAVAHNLPPQPTPFIGRDAELATLDKLLADPAVRLVTIVGAGGMGKTRLALACAEQQQRRERFANGVYFVPLAPLKAVDHIIPTVAEALGFQLDSGSQTRSPAQQISDYLRQKRLLIVLDNFEHLLDGANIVAGILQHAPDVKILVTARERLNLREEQIFAIQGLLFPDWETPEDAAGYTAVQLFLQSAKRVQHDFALAPDDLTYLTRICRLVEGMPLGIELAASWVDTLAPVEIAAEIQQSLDFLATDVRNAPARHRSMRAVFDTSWQRLSAQEQTLMARFSIFRGGFTRHAAQQITTASVRDLSVLTSKSLLQTNRAANRYQIHELLRQYGAEKLAEKPADEAAARDRHSAYYADRLHQHAVVLKSAEQRAALTAIQAEMENVRAAWDWAIAQKQTHTLDQALESLGQFYEWHGRVQEGQAAFRAALGVVDAGAEPRLRVRLSSWLATFVYRLGRIDEAKELCEQSLVLLDSPSLVDQDRRAERADILLGLGRSVGFSAIDPQANQAELQLYEQSLALYEALQDRWGMAEAMFALCERGRSLRDTATVEQWWRQLAEIDRLGRRCEALCRASGNQAGLAKILLSLAANLIFTSPLDEALTTIEAAMALCHALDLKDMLLQTTSWRANILMFQGNYAQAQVANQAAEELLHELGNSRKTLWISVAWGLMALAEQRYAEAQQILLASVVRFQEMGGEYHRVLTLAYLGIAELQLGHVHVARQHLIELLRVTTELYFHVFLVQGTLYLAALHLAHQGAAERAIELYSLLSHLWIAGEPRLYEDIVGRTIDAAASALSAADVAAAQERGRTLDLWATAKDMLAELD